MTPLELVRMGLGAAALAGTAALALRAVLRFRGSWGWLGTGWLWLGPVRGTVAGRAVSVDQRVLGGTVIEIGGRCRFGVQLARGDEVAVLARWAGGESADVVALGEGTFALSQDSAATARLLGAPGVRDRVRALLQGPRWATLREGGGATLLAERSDPLPSDPAALRALIDGWIAVIEAAEQPGDGGR